MEIIRKRLTLEYWPVSDWFEGRLREIPAVLSQGRTLDELEQHLREDCSDVVGDPEHPNAKQYAHLDPTDILDAEFRMVELDRLGAAMAQLESLSQNRQEKVFAYIEDLVDLEALERRADDEDARQSGEERDEEDW